MSLITIFSGGQADLPDLHVYDSQEGANVPVAGIEGWDGDYIQVVALANAPMELVEVGTTLALNGVSEIFTVQRLSQVLTRVEFSGTGATCQLEMSLIDKNDEVVVFGPFSFAGDVTQDTIEFSYGQVLPTYGASKVTFEVTALSAGTINISVSGV